MEEYIRKMIAYGIPEKTAEAICKTFVGDARALDRIIGAIEKQPCTSANVEAFQP